MVITERGIIKLTLIPSYYSGSQIGRSIKKKKRTYKKELFKIVKNLFKKIDNNIIKNRDVRNGILQLKKKSKVSIGQAQKVVNVCLKYYAVLANKKPKILKELDCPLDSTVFKKYGDHKKGLNKTTNLTNLDNFEKYKEWQELLRKKGRSIKIYSDLIYDKRRMKKFLK